MPVMNPYELSQLVFPSVMKLESLLNHERLTDDEAMVLTFPVDPTYAKP